MADDTTNIRDFVTRAVDLLRGKMLTSAEARVLHEAFAPLILAVQYHDPARTADPEQEGVATLSESGIRADERERIALEIRSFAVPWDNVDNVTLERMLTLRDVIAELVKDRMGAQ